MHENNKDNFKARNESFLRLMCVGLQTKRNASKKSRHTNNGISRATTRGAS